MASRERLPTDEVRAAIDKFDPPLPINAKDLIVWLLRWGIGGEWFVSVCREGGIDRYRQRVKA